MARPRPDRRPSTPDRRKLAREAQERQVAAAKRRRNRIQLAVVGGVAVVVLAIVAGAVLIGRHQQSGSTPTADTTVTVANVKVPFAITGSAVRVGPADAAARVDLWVDYSCPHCQEFEAENSDTLNQLIAGGNVSVSYHNIQVHSDYGTAAGGAAACVAAKDPEHWVGFNSSLYANESTDTDSWTAAQFRTFAEQQGVNADALGCITADPYSGWIADNTADAAKQGVSGTPTLFFNGQQSETVTGQALKTKVDQLAGR